MITVGITRGIPTLLMAWASGPQSCLNHSAFCRRKINHKTIFSFPQMVPTDNTQKISRLDASGLNDLEGLKKEKKRIKGDWG